MILKELNLIGFGKFENTKIQLERGLNIIYGENESGKSTLHSFIEGMFFGFLKPNVKSAIYNDEHAKYEPWTKSRYAGIIRFQYEGKDYRIERDFTKGTEETKVFEEITGKEISKNIETGRTRILQPGIHFFGLNTRVFSNTIYIKQLQSVTDEKLANDIREKLVNVNTSLDDNISVDKAISDIDNLLAEIGTEKAYTKPYAKNLNEIEKLEKQKEDIKKDKRSYEFYLQEKSNLEKEKIKEEEKLFALQEQLMQVKILEKKEILEEATALCNEIKNLKLEKEKLKDFSDISKKDYEEAIKLNESIENLNRNMDDMTLNLELISKKIEAFDPKTIELHSQEISSDLNKAYNYYEELDIEKQKLQFGKDENYIRILERDIKAKHDERKKHKRNSIMLLIINLFIVIFLHLNRLSTMFLFIPLILIGIVIIYYITGQRNIGVEGEKIKDELDQINFQEKLNDDRIEEINQIQEDLLFKNSVNTKQELKNLIDELRIEAYNNTEKEKQYNEFKKERRNLRDRLEENKVNMGKNISRLRKIYLENNCQNLEELSLALDNKRLYEETIKDISSKEEVLEKTLGIYTIAELRKDLSQIIVDKAHVKEISKEKLANSIEDTRDVISRINLELATIEERIKSLSKKISILVEIEEEIYRKHAYKKELDHKIAALNLAKSTIEQLSEEIHTEFAPNINSKLSKIVGKITSDKYNSIKIGEDLSITLENPDTEEIIKIEALSGGTIDQLYFALRFGIIDEITEKNLPLFLDDCFTQYDEHRLKNVLEFLLNTIENRQILLFTCHKREKYTLEKLNTKFNLINLI